ncbi:hypothetical protein CN934_32490 [Ensifer sp. MMN_5]|nr:hypothetical protein CN934_32490 [Ensifer sp. MMN_5]
MARVATARIGPIFKAANLLIETSKSAENSKNRFTATKQLLIRLFAKCDSPAARGEGYRVRGLVPAF